MESLLLRLFDLYQFAIIGYILMSWFPGARQSSIGHFLSSIVEPYLEPFRRIIPPIGMLDISAIVALFVLRFARTGLIYVLTAF
ncbi:YggT family protein [Halolactibacillus halophilus]|uniref:Membrane protein n=1 Tax=Halolactibacillus halophilus TaxID=306540 RepID=A0A1I5LQI8_9BACI|nr:YggT family protein [Halolactibacillus halophilus]GEM00701.1 membrane protein [Halolactibacillus halophilus]SFO99644.1 YggT family protein [Halolactibacillus halophilus]